MAHKDVPKLSQVDLKDYFSKKDAFSIESTQFLITAIDDSSLDPNELIRASANYFHETKDLRMLSLYNYLLTNQAIKFKHIHGFVQFCYELTLDAINKNSPYQTLNNVNLVGLFHFLYHRSLMNSLDHEAFLQYAMQPDLQSYTSQIIKSLPTVKMHQLFNDLLMRAINFSDRKTLVFLNNIDSSLYESLKGKLQPRYQEHCKRLFMLSESLAAKITGLISQFAQGPGNLDEKGASLLCKYLRDKKAPVDFLPIILNVLEADDFFKDFREYAKAYHNIQTQPVCQNFVITGIHWLTGTIQITAEGEVFVLFLDSFGKINNAGEKLCTSKDSESDEEYENYDDTSNLFNITFDFVEIFIEKFSDLDPDKIFIFVPEFRRQYSEKGCSVIAIRDLRKLENYERFIQKNIFMTCAASEISKNPIQFNDNDKVYQIRFCELPLIFMPTAQTRAYQEAIEARPIEEQQKAINKRGETAIQATSKFFTETSGFMNRSNELKLKKWGIVLSEYLVKFVTDFKRLPETEMEEFSGASYHQRISTCINSMSAPRAAASSSASSLGIFKDKKTVTLKEEAVDENMIEHPIKPKNSPV